MSPSPGNASGNKSEATSAPASESVKAKLATRKSLKPDEAVKEEGVPQHVYLQYIKEELTSEAACLELPLTLLILVAFSLLAVRLLDQQKVFAVEGALRNDITLNSNFAWQQNYGDKEIKDVLSIADFWSWLRLGYLPLVVQQEWTYAEPYPSAVLGKAPWADTNYSGTPDMKKWRLPGYDRQAAPVPNDYLWYNRLVGGIRMAQQVETPSYDACLIPFGMDRDAVQKWIGKPCTPSEIGELTPERSDTEYFEGFTRTQWLLTELDSIEELKRTIIDMEDGCQATLAAGEPLSSCRCTWCRQQVPVQPWLDEQTRRIEVTFVSYNPQYGLYSYVGANFFFRGSGNVVQLLNIMSAYADPQVAPFREQVTVYIAGLLWLVALIYVLVGEVREILGVLRRSEGRWWTALKEYFTIWNAIDWTSFCLGIVVIAFYFRMRLTVGKVNGHFINMMQASTQRVARDVYQATTEAFFQAVQGMCDREKEFRISLCMYPSVVLLRLFKSFAAQPRLAVVTATLTRAAPDLLHFFIIFFCIYLCMTVMSILFFGRDVEDFSTLPRAVHSCFLAMFGKRDWASWRDIGFLKAALWFWAFMLLMVLVLLNMLLAIIMDAYSAEKERASNAQTLWSQVKDMYRRRVQFKRGERVRLNDIWDALLADSNGDEHAMLKSKRKLFPELLVSLVPNMKYNQAHRLLVKSMEHQKRLQEASITIEDILADIKQKLTTVENNMEGVVGDTLFLMDQVDYYDRLEAPGDEEYDRHFGADGARCSTMGAEPERAPADSAPREAEGDRVPVSAESLLSLSLTRIETWQDAFEKRQDELHELLVEMQLMVQQQTGALAAMAEVASLLNGAPT